MILTQSLPLVDHLWQSTLFAIAAGVLTLAFRNNRAQTRYCLWLIASMKFLIPFSVLIGAGSYFVRHSVVTVAPTRLPVIVSHFTESFVVSPSLAMATTPAHEAFTASLILAVLGMVWAIGFIVFVSSWWVRWRHVRAALRAASPVQLPINLKAMSSPAFMEPGVFGILDPILLLPEGIAEQLTPRQLEGILVHEQCHVRRRDNLATAVHMVVEAVFWFHPLVWFLGARLMEERERACDEEVLRMGNEPQAYAEGVLRVCELYLPSPLRCMSGVTGSNLKARIQAILAGRTGCDLSFAKKMALTAAAILALATPIVVGIIHAAPIQRYKPSFEVASVKRDNSVGRGLNIVPQAGGRLVATGATLSKLIAFAYVVQDFQIVGGPGWVSSDRWEIQAKAEDGSIPPSTAPRDPTKPGPLALRLQALLADRFGLKVHRVIQELPVYQLSIAPAGLKMKLSEDQTPVNPLQQGGPASQDGRMRRGALGFTFGGGHIEAAAVPLSNFVGLLSGIMDRTIVDKTGLNGLYDIELNWTPDPGQRIGLSGPLPPGIERPPVDPSGPSIFAALQDQLGLRLQSAKGPVEVLVIDDAHKPTEN